MEEFYSLQGEGFYTGQAAYFLRIGGCDVGCRWCDVRESWNSCYFQPVPTDLIVDRAAKCPAGAVVVTGGEPMRYNLDRLCKGLKKNGIKTFLETSGTCPMSGIWDWICLSPKRECPPLKAILDLADELKIIIYDQTDFEWAEENASLSNPASRLYLQPEWSNRLTMMPMIVNYIKDHPRWKISLQSHKYIGIP